jgi:hypothetical protein
VFCLKAETGETCAPYPILVSYWVVGESKLDDVNQARGISSRRLAKLTSKIGETVTIRGIV